MSEQLANKGEAPRLLVGCSGAVGGGKHVGKRLNGSNRDVTKVVTA
jgi:hypothetical protein